MRGDIGIISCATCPCGVAAGLGTGGRCPFVDRQRLRGEYVYFEGEPATRVWFLKRGVVVLTRSVGGDGGEKESPRAARLAGSFLGLEALVRPTYLDTARVTSPATLCGAPRDTVDAWLAGHGSPARMALEQLLRTAVGEGPRGASADGSSLCRVARWLLSEAHNGSGARLPRRYLAGLLGMVPETLSRALAELAASGAIDLTRTSVRIRDAEAVRSAARS